MEPNHRFEMECEIHGLEQAFAPNMEAMQKEINTWKNCKIKSIAEYEN